jgi:hypothetical protein
MKLLSVQLARSTWLVDVREFNPRGLSPFASLVPALVQEYRFAEYPREADDPQRGMRFARGQYVTKAGETLAVDLSVFSDGVVADTTATTEDSDQFLDDITSLLPRLGYSFDVSSVRRRVYLSQLFVQSPLRLALVDPRLASFGKKLTEAVGHESRFEFSAFELWPDQTRVFKPAKFSFQRQLGDPPSGDRYWSQAALSTDKHLGLLGELEAALA